MTMEALVHLPRDEQRQRIGEVLYSQIREVHPNMAGKLTGMILELELEDLLEVVHKKDKRDKMVKEAMDVLQMHY
uniref:PABC domain-containing protein n=1 Tax=Arcella intermedia TaxID=1963864 RepID=A0A6B2LVP5_9EUKA